MLDKVADNIVNKNTKELIGITLNGILSDYNKATTEKNKYIRR